MAITPVEQQPAAPKIGDTSKPDAGASPPDSSERLVGEAQGLKGAPGKPAQPGEVLTPHPGDIHTGSPETGLNQVRLAALDPSSLADTKAMRPQGDAGVQPLAVVDTGADLQAQLKKGLVLPGKDNGQGIKLTGDGNQLHITGDGHTYDLNKVDGSDQFTDKAGNKVAFHDGSVDVTVDGRQYSINQKEIKEQIGGQVEVTHKKEHGDGEPTAAGTIETRATKDKDDPNKKEVHVAGTDGVQITAQVDGSRTIETPPGDAQQKLTFTPGTDGQPGKFVLTESDKSQIQLVQGANGAWTGTHLNPDGSVTPLTPAEMQGLTIGGNKVTDGQDLQLSGDTTIASDGTVKTKVNGVPGAGAGQPLDTTIKAGTATVEIPDGKGGTITVAVDKADPSKVETAAVDSTNNGTVATVGPALSLTVGPGTRDSSTGQVTGSGAPPDLTVAAGPDQTTVVQLSPGGQPETQFTLAPASVDPNNPNYQLQQICDQSTGMMIGPDGAVLAGGYQLNADGSLLLDANGNPINLDGSTGINGYTDADGYQISNAAESTDAAAANANTQDTLAFTVDAGAQTFAAAVVAAPTTPQGALGEIDKINGRLAQISELQAHATGVAATFLQQAVDALKIARDIETARAQGAGQNVVQNKKDPYDANRQRETAAA